MDIPANEITAIIGPSGCGKSTFLRSINRMHELAHGARMEGRILLDGVDIYDRAVDAVDLRRLVGMVFQRPNPFPTMSIYGNVAAGLRLGGGPKPADLDEIVERCLTRAALWDEVKDHLGDPGHVPVGRSAAAPVHRPRPRGGPGGDPHGRAGLRARPDRDAPDRGADAGAPRQHTRS